MKYRYLKLRQLITGWVSYFRLADMKTKCQELDEWTRRRIIGCVIGNNGRKLRPDTIIW